MDIQALIDQVRKERNLVKIDEGFNEGIEELKSWAAEYRGEDQVISSLEIMERMENRDDVLIMSGWKEVDDILGGFTPQQLITIAAATKSGKTSWAVDLTVNLKEYHPLWFPFEEGAEEIIRKFLQRGEDPPLFYVPQQMTGNTMLWLEKRIVESIAKYKTKVVFIDHLHFIVDMGSGENMSLQIGKTMRALKGLAKKWDIVIFLIAHLKKTKLDIQPTTEDLRDSSFIAQESDTVIMLWREMIKLEGGQVEITNNVNLSIQANRRTGKTGNVKFVFKDGKFFVEEWKGYEEQKNEVDKEYENWK